MEQGSDWFIWLPILVGGFYLLTPLITYSTLRQRADPDLVPIDPAQTQLPQAVQNYFDRVEQALRPCGFTRVGDIALPNQVPNVAANLRFFVNQETADTASCTAAYANAGGTWTMRSRYVQFSTRYRDESVYFTSNCEVASVFPPRPRVHGTRITQVKNPAQLYAVHRWITREPSQTQKKTLPLIDQFNGDAAAYQRWLLIDELKDAADAGYLYLSESQHAYRATLRHSDDLETPPALQADPTAPAQAKSRPDPRRASTRRKSIDLISHHGMSNRCSTGFLPS